MTEKVLEFEVNQIVESISSYSQGYAPKILYCFVDKRITNRLFE